MSLGIAPSTKQEPLSAARGSEVLTLSPCPFCGEAEHLYVEQVAGTWRHPACFVRCDTCGAQSGETDAGNAVERWNSRATLGGKDTL